MATRHKEAKFAKDSCLSILAESVNVIIGNLRYFDPCCLVK